MNKWIKPMLFLVIMILACSAFVRFFSQGETLSEYADNNPELALATPASTGRAVSPESESLRDGSLKKDFASATPDASPDNPSDQSADNSCVIVTASLGAAATLYTEKQYLTISGENDSTDCEKDFFYEPLSGEIIARITGISYPVSETGAPSLPFQAVNTVPDTEALAVSYEDLRYLSVLHYDFNGDIQTGELICNAGIAQDLLEIFYELFLNEYRIEKIRLIDEYDGDDTASMLDNNTSCFNYRVVDGTDSLSKHALGCAIDINPFYNPYVVFNRGGTGETYISPAGSEIYADRSLDFPYKIDADDLCYRLFKDHGFTWGGDWNSSKDYQHFQKVVN